MTAYIRVRRDTGKLAWIRTDAITAFMENETKLDGKAVPCLTIMVSNNVAWHVFMTGDELIESMRACSGQQIQLHVFEQAPEPG